MPHGDPNVKVSFRLRRPLYRRLDALASREHEGNLSRALEAALEQGLAVFGLEDALFKPNPRER